MNILIENPMFGILLTLLAFELGLWIQKKTKILLLNPLLLAIVIIIFVLIVSGIDLQTYQLGGDIINLFLGPATVVLAIPLYQQRASLKNFFLPIMLGIVVGVIVGFIATFSCAYIMGFDTSVIASLLPKSITTPIGIELSTQLAGIPSITVLTILITGIIGAVASDLIFRVFHITHPIAKGVALGTSAHAIGTTKALRMGQVEGAMSSLAIGVAGIVTVFLIPLLWQCLLPYLSR